jgi:secreted trypsin-like serine protease
MGRSRFALLTYLVLALAAPPAAHAQSPEPRIIGGSTTTIEQYPWQAAVVYDPAKVGGNPFQRQFCGGSLITPYIVLTAAHCVYDTDPQNNSSLDPDDVNVVLGRTTLSGAPPASEFNVQGASYQANYDDGYGPGPGVPSNDVGYIVLQSPYNAATPIDIAGSNEGALWDSASPEQITGWGATAESGPGSGGSDTLRVATVPIVSDSGCAATYGVYFNSTTMVCAGYPEGGVDTCYGDSGGPLQAALQGGGYRLVGITSWGAGCAQPNAPGVYTRVAGDSLRPAVASTVFDLETAFGLPHENIIGGGGGTDTDPPETTITLGPTGPTNDPTPTFGFSSDEPGSSFECRFDADPFGPCSGPGASHTPAAPLADGAHTFEVRATDPPDNIDPTPASRSFTVDIQAPSPPPPLTPPPVLSSPPDGAPPDGRVSAKSNQKVGGAISLEVGCDEDCTAVAAGLVVATAAEPGLASASSANGKRKFKLTAARAVIAAGGSATLELQPKGKKARRTLRKLVKSGATAKANINVTLTDLAGNSTSEKLIVKLKK